MKKELTWFQQSFEGAYVKYNVLSTREGRRPFGDDYELTNEELTANAVRRGKTTWDEQDIVELHGTKFAEVITLHQGPPKVETPETPVE